MMLVLRKKLSYLLPLCTANRTSLTAFSSSSHQRISSLLRFSTLTSKDPSPKNSFMVVEYLIKSCGFSSDQAIKASRNLMHIKSPSQPDSVISFLKNIGLSDTQINTLISKHPQFLCARVEKTLRPKILRLQQLGFSQSELVQLVSDNTTTLRSRDLQPKIEFWRALLRTNENLLKAMRRGNLLSCNISKKIVPTISLLQNSGISDDMIVKMVLRSPISFARNTNTVKDLIRLVDELGVSRSSGMFPYLLRAVGQFSKATLDCKLNNLKSLGWSEEDVLSAIRKAPNLLTLSDKKMRSNMDFLVKEAGCEPSHVAHHPLLLLYSLDGRLIPRCHVLWILESKGLRKSGLTLSPVMALPEMKFLEKFVLAHVEKIPNLHESYVALCAEGSVTSETEDLFNNLMDCPGLRGKCMPETVEGETVNFC